MKVDKIGEYLTTQEISVPTGDSIVIIPKGALVNVKQLDLSGHAVLLNYHYLYIWINEYLHLTPYSEDPEVDSDSSNYFCVKLGREVKGGCHAVYCFDITDCPYTKDSEGI